MLAVSLAMTFHRMEAVAKRVLDRIMSGVEKTEAYLGTRRIEVYRAALEGDAQDRGIITTREQAILSALRRKLDISDDEADVAEREFRNLLPSPRHTIQKVAV